MRNSGTQAIDRALDLLSSIIEDEGQTSIAVIGRLQSLPAATTYRITSALVRNGFLIPIGRGKHVAGSRLIAIGSEVTLRPALVALSRPVLKALAREVVGIAHLGILEQGMVTYLVKAGRGYPNIFTEEGTQLEAYCSGIGKVLLAALPPAEQDQYLSDGPFVALTSHTITAPDSLAQELSRVGHLGFARDSQEVAFGLHCLAVALRDPSKVAIAALSVSREVPDLDESATLAAMRAAAAKIERALFGSAAVSRD